MQKEMVNKTLIIEGIFVIVMVALTIVNVYDLLDPSYFKSNLPLEGTEDVEFQDIVERCDNLTMFQAAKCVNKQVRLIYNYNISNTLVNPNFTELKLSGGACEDYSKLYCDIGKIYGYNTKKVVVSIGKEQLELNGELKNRTVGHMFCVWSGNKEDKGYIILDQIRMQRMGLGVENDK